VDLFEKMYISEEFLRNLMCIIRDKTFPIIFNDHDKNINHPNIKLNCNLMLYSKKVLDLMINSIPKDHITEFGAIALILSYVILTEPKIHRIDVYKKGQGLDYHWRKDGNLYKLEISGCDVENKKTFYNRIWKKNNKFQNRYYGEPAFERLIGIVDFFYEKYRLWKIE